VKVIGSRGARYGGRLYFLDPSLSSTPPGCLTQVIATDCRLSLARLIDSCHY